MASGRVFTALALFRLTGGQKVPGATLGQRLGSILVKNSQTVDVAKYCGDNKYQRQAIAVNVAPNGLGVKRSEVRILSPRLDLGRFENLHYYTSPVNAPSSNEGVAMALSHRKQKKAPRFA